MEILFLLYFVAVSKTENQDFAVILVSKDKSGKVSVHIVGDKYLYGKDYVVEPKVTTGASVSAVNPGYSGGSSETMNLPAVADPNTTTTVVVQSPPIVQYLYSPALYTVLSSLLLWILSSLHSSNCANSIRSLLVKSLSLS